MFSLFNYCSSSDVCSSSWCSVLMFFLLVVLAFLSFLLLLLLLEATKIKIAIFHSSLWESRS